MSQTEERVEGEKMEGLVQQQVVSLICTVYRGWVYSELFALTVVVLDGVEYLMIAVNGIVYDVGLYCYNVLCSGYVGSLSLLNI